MMITPEALIEALECADDVEGERLQEVFYSIDGTRMYVSAEDEYTARKTSLPPMFALERFRGAVDDSSRGKLAAGVLVSFSAQRDMAHVAEWVAIMAPKLRCRPGFYAELYADCLLLASEFCAAWNRSQLRLVST